MCRYLVKPTLTCDIVYDYDIHLHLQVKSAEASAKVTPDYKVCLGRLYFSNQFIDVRDEQQLNSFNSHIRMIYRPHRNTRISWLWERRKQKMWTANRYKHTIVLFVVDMGFVF